MTAQAEAVIDTSGFTDDALAAEARIARNFAGYLGGGFLLERVVALVPVDSADRAGGTDTLLQAEISDVLGDAGDGHIIVMQAPRSVVEAAKLWYGTDVVAILHRATNRPRSSQ